VILDFSAKKASLKTFKTLLFLTALGFVAACATSHQEAMPPGREQAEAWDGSRPNTIETRLQAEYRRWKGAEHVIGGTDLQGVDCSGFVQAVYKNLFDIDLPRTTEGQVRVGKPVERHELQPGDLVFFLPPSYPRHVGIYFNSNQFVHASKTNGVTISSLDHEYWGRYYWTARRFSLPD
jgi:cell wall-associated NlpC family hydrolase